MTEEKQVLATMGGDVWSDKKLTVTQDEVSASDPLRRNLKQTLKDGIPQPEVAAESVDTTEAPPVPTQASPEQIYGELAAAGGDTFAAEAIYSKHSLDRYRFVDEMQPAEWISEIGKQQSKATKQANIGASAAVVESGQAGGDIGMEALEAELQSFYAGDHGSLATPANVKRMKEISQELNKLVPPVNV